MILVVLISGCIGQGSVAGASESTEQQSMPEEIAKRECARLCEQRVSEGVDISSGPCLSDNIIDGWVCDVAHWPRIDIDNIKENQCPAYGRSAQHFVEVDENCKVIRAK